jgi:tetratricopeptide (TPR) repeat protein
MSYKTKKAFFLLLLTLFIVAPLTAQSIDTFDVAILTMRDNHLKGPILAAESLEYIETIKAQIPSDSRSPQETFILAHAEYYHGLYYYRMDDFQKAEPLLTKATQLILDLLETFPHSEVHRLYAEALGIKMLIGGIGAIISNYFPLEHHLNEALRLDQSNIRATLIFNMKHVHAPPFLGQDLDRAERVYSEILTREEIDSYVEFVCLHTLGSIWMNRGNNQLALQWFEKALELYPGNPHVLEKLYMIGLDPVSMGFQVPLFLRERYGRS